MPVTDFRRRWLKLLMPLVVMVAVLTGVYFQTVQLMAYQWWNHETYTHGMVVPLMSLWLIWQKREHWLQLPMAPNLWFLVPLALLSFAWLLGDLAIVFPVTQFAFVGMVIFAVPALLGWPVAKAMSFPLLFLLFCVPVGEVLLPTLMTWTADFTVMALRFTGIPVYREGQQFVIPSGNWSVVEACSGVRYLIASSMIGTLYAYLTFRSFHRRLLFILVSLLVPLVANWCRAYIIVMIGHLSDNRLATGVDHLIYGWIFFGLVMLLMFWIGSWWREDGDIIQAETSAIKPTSEFTVFPTRTWGICLLAVLVSGFGKFASLIIIDHDKAMSAPVLSVPGNFGPWLVKSENFTDWHPKYSEPSAKIQQSYGNGDKDIGIYIAYYRGQNTERKLVSSANVLVSTSDHIWSQTAVGRIPLSIAGTDLNALAIDLLNQNRNRLVVWSWYWVDGKFVSSDYRAKVYTAWSRLMGHGDDSAVIMVYAPKQGDRQTVEANMRAFVADAMPVISESLRQTSQAQ